MKLFKKNAFTVIGMEGSTADGAGFIQDLWQSANAGFSQVEMLAKRDENGNLVGIWGAMTDLGRNYLPWEENFTKGLYLAGVEVMDDAEAPEGWTKWNVPAFEFACVPGGGMETFRKGLEQLEAEGLGMAGAAMDFTEPKTGTGYTLFPVRRL